MDGNVNLHERELGRVLFDADAGDKPPMPNEEAQEQALSLDWFRRNIED